MSEHRHLIIKSLPKKSPIYHCLSTTFRKGVHIGIQTLRWEANIKVIGTVQS